MKNIGSRVKKIREEIGYTQQYVADHLGVHRTNYSRIENNHQKLTPEQIILFCELCDISADYLLGIEAKNKRVYTTETTNKISMKLAEINELLKK